ncbi:MAG TPA: flagellar hook-length control protein FliK [Methylococcaceae bacterium]|nr:flagellar hook-length control protein FliK [Methylococcaceae bacterium]
MTPTLTLQFNPSLPSATGGVDALASIPAGTDFLQALQQWLAQLQPVPVAPGSQPQTPAVELPSAQDGRALLASLLAARHPLGQDGGSAPGEENAPAILEMAEDALALLKQWLLEAGDTPAPGIGEAVSAAVKPSADGEVLPPGESLPPDALATLSTLSRQLEHWLQRAGNEAGGEDGATAENEIDPVALPPSPGLVAASASGVFPVPLQAAGAPEGDDATAGAKHPVTSGLIASLVRKAEADAVRPDSGKPAASSQPAPSTSQTPLAGRGVPDAAPQSAHASAVAVAASGAVPPPPATPAFSAVLDDLTPPVAPQAAEAPPALPDAASPVAAQALASNPPAAAPERPAPPPVATPVGHPGWDTEMSQRVVWMSGNSVSSAEIHLNPPHLGPVEVRISVGQDQQTSVQFLSPHAAVREALEAALPRLRDQFGAQQLTLGDVSVSQHSDGQQNDSQQARGFQFQQQQQSSAWRGSEQEFSLADGAVLPEDGERPRPVRVGQGLLNLYV